MQLVWIFNDLKGDFMQFNWAVFSSALDILQQTQNIHIQQAKKVIYNKHQQDNYYKHTQHNKHYYYAISITHMQTWCKKAEINCKTVWIFEVEDSGSSPASHKNYQYI